MGSEDEPQLLRVATHPHSRRKIEMVREKRRPIGHAFIARKRILHAMIPDPVKDVSNVAWVIIVLKATAKRPSTFSAKKNLQTSREVSLPRQKAVQSLHQRL
jgi:hypothetical protein